MHHRKKEYVSRVAREINSWVPQLCLRDMYQDNYFVILALDTFLPLLPPEMKIHLHVGTSQQDDKLDHSLGTSAVEQESQVKPDYSSGCQGFQELLSPTSYPKQAQTWPQTSSSGLYPVRA